MKVTVPATSANLGPGFDTLGIAVGIKNQVIIKPSKFHSVSLKGEGANNPVLKDNNMFLSIFNDFYNNLSTKKTFFLDLNLLMKFHFLVVWVHLRL